MYKNSEINWKRICKDGILFGFVIVTVICAYICVSNVSKINKSENFLKASDRLGIENSLVYYAGMESEADNTVEGQRDLVRICESCASVKEVYPRYSFSVYTCLQEYVPEQTEKYIMDGLIVTLDSKFSDYFFKDYKTYLTIATDILGGDRNE